MKRRKEILLSALLDLFMLHGMRFFFRYGQKKIKVKSKLLLLECMIVIKAFHSFFLLFPPHIKFMSVGRLDCDIGMKNNMGMRHLI